MNRFVDKIVFIYIEALKGRKKIAQGQAAQQSQPWVMVQYMSFFSSFAPGRGE